MSDTRKFEYILNSMELAAQQENPADHDYAAKRRAVLNYVAAIEAANAKMGESLFAVRQALHGS